MTGEILRKTSNFECKFKVKCSTSMSFSVESTIWDYEKANVEFTLWQTEDVIQRVTYSENQDQV